MHPDLAAAPRDARTDAGAGARDRQRRRLKKPVLPSSQYQSSIVDENMQIAIQKT
jgi:hypothetical protein